MRKKPKMYLAIVVFLTVLTRTPLLAQSVYDDDKTALLANLTKTGQMKAKFFELCPIALSNNLPTEWHILNDNYSNPIESFLVSALCQVNEINDVAMSMTATMIFRIFWLMPCGRDIREELLPGYKKLPQIVLDRVQFEIPATSVWWPDMQHINAIGEARPLRDERLIKVRPFRVPGPRFLIYCVRPFTSVCFGFSYTKFPFDTSSCSFEWENENWENEVVIKIDSIGVQDGYIPLRDDDIWEFVSYNGSSFNAGGFHHVTATLTVKRKWRYYVGNVFVPTIALLLMQIFGLIMDPSHPDRPTYCVTVNLSMAVLLTLIFSLIPRTAQEVYLINIVVAFMIICLLITVYTLVACFICRLKPLRRLLFNDDNKGGVRVIRLIDCVMSVSCFLSGFVVFAYYGAKMLL